MSLEAASIRNISDTARWVAVYRARESERPDAHFQDRFARRLAGERGEQIAASMRFAEKHSWPFVARTWLIDQMIAAQLGRGADAVINLAAGLDARPYRMDLPSSLSWIEVDLPEILAHKQALLDGEQPVCALERMALDLSQVEARRELFERLGRRFERALVISEGLLVYLTEEQVTELARDLAAPGCFRQWIIDLASPALQVMLKKKMGAPLDQAGVPLKFAPAEGPDFFRRSGWAPREVRSMIHAAARLGRLPLLLRLMSRLASPRFNAKRPWSAVCRLARTEPGG
ncbi:MAG TPA: SAM-dependent methyltransferase [Acidobacteriota bacterium]|jgi:methyltransferase (TIGR00027 family)